MRYSYYVIILGSDLLLIVLFRSLLAFTAVVAGLPGVYNTKIKKYNNKVYK